MNVLISMLRGINVSGQKRVQMPELIKIYEDLKYINITTYINSGNVVFSTDTTDLNHIRDSIQEGILKKFGFDVPVIILTKNEMQKTVSNNPYLQMKNIDVDKLYVTFLSETPNKSNLEKILNFKSEPDSFHQMDREIFLHCPNGYGRTKLNNTFFESKLKVTTTTRNWKTVNELLRIANEKQKVS